MDKKIRSGFAGRALGGIITLMVLAAMLLFLPATAYAASDFVITDYDIHMTVNEDDTYQITETIKVHFTAPSHGIYRSMPRRVTLDRDGQYSAFNVAVKDFKVESGQEFDSESDSSNWMWRIGDPDEYADTDTEYVISYLYDTRGDHFKGGDEVFHNLVGTTWEAQSIEHVSWEITFPEDIDPAKVGMKNGDNVDVPFEVDGSRIISGETDMDTLGGLTVRAVLPDGYFTRQEGNALIPFYIITGLLALLACGGLVIWRRYGIDPDYPETIEFYPPEGLSAPETAFLEKGAIDKSDVISILLTLADRGYLVIHEIEIEKTTGKGILKKSKTQTSYEIERIREYDGDDEAERMFMEGLFADGEWRSVETDAAFDADDDMNSFNTQKHLFVKMEDLEESFYKTAEKIEETISKKYEGLLYDKESYRYARIMYLAGVAGVLVLFVAARLIGGIGLGWPPEGIIMLLMQPILMIAGFRSIAEWVKTRNGFILVIIGLGLAIGGAVMARFIGTFYGAMTIPFIIGMVMCMILFVVGGLCERKTEFFVEMQAKIKGYKRFLETAEKDKMDTLAEQDPGYFYHNLAYAFALGVTTVYARRFISMARKPPEWYDTPHYYDSWGHDNGNGFVTERFADSLNEMLTSVSSSMSSSPSDGSGGGSFSGGGGGGGGGGGSW